MSWIDDMQALVSPQSAQQPKPNTLASAATIAPKTKYTRITGTVQITKITPPVEGYHELVLSFASAYAALATGGVNPGGIAVAYTSVVDRPIMLFYDPRTQLYYPAAVV